MATTRNHHKRLGQAGVLCLLFSCTTLPAGSPPVMPHHLYEGPATTAIRTKADVRAERLAREAAWAKDAAQNVTSEWAVTLQPGQYIEDMAQLYGASQYRKLGSLENVYLMTIPGSASQAKATAEMLRSAPGIKNAAQQVRRERFKRVTITDPLFAAQWHLDITNDTNFGSPIGVYVPGVDANVVTAWNSQGVDGSGVTIGIVDDGLQRTHPDLSPNYNANASYDYNSGNADPSPNNLATDSHGTSVAGVAAAADDGSSCGVGAAYNATLAGLQLISAPTSDADEAAALSYTEAGVSQKNTIDVFNNSWGPGDDGIVHDDSTGAGPLVQAALLDGVTNGRGGKGVIYVWAAGNGRGSEYPLDDPMYVPGDNVNYDNYANSRYTIAVGAVRATEPDSAGQYAFYSEPGAAMHITAPSNNWEGEGIRTTDLLGDNGGNTSTAPDSSGDTNCRDEFGGTSSAAPLASGIIALMLDANPNLGWRDVQHILAETAVKNDPTDSDWTTNGAGFHINHNYGFGMIDANAAVAAAKTWSNVRAATTVTSSVSTVNASIADNNSTGVTRTINITDDIQLEHVEVVFSATHTFRGDLKIELTSPDGTVSVLADSRPADSNENYNSWKFMTVRNWGEMSAGTWSLKVSDLAEIDTGTFNSWQLILHGTGHGAAKNDFTGDGKSDALIRNTSTGQWWMYPLDGRTVVSGANLGSVTLTGSLGWQHVGTADFTGDGKADVLIRNATTGQWYMYPLDGRTVVSGANLGPVAMTGSLAWQPVGVADFTGDGKADVLIRNTTTGQWYMYPLDGRTVVSGANLGSVPMTGSLAWQPVGAADYTGDGKADMLIRNTSTGQWWMYPLDGRTVVSGANLGSVAMTGSLVWEPVGAADYTGDGKADMLIRNTSTGQWWMYPLDGRTVVSGANLGSVAMTGSLAWEAQQVDDFTGDGKADVLIRNTSTGQWYMYPLDGRTVVSGASLGSVPMTGSLIWAAQ